MFFFTEAVQPAVRAISLDPALCSILQLVLCLVGTQVFEHRGRAGAAIVQSTAEKTQTTCLILSGSVPCPPGPLLCHYSVFVSKHTVAKARAQVLNGLHQHSACSFPPAGQCDQTVKRVLVLEECFV